jgi:hypothetical protein
MLGSSTTRLISCRPRRSGWLGCCSSLDPETESRDRRRWAVGLSREPQRHEWVGVAIDGDPPDPRRIKASTRWRLGSNSAKYIPSAATLSPEKPITEVAARASRSRRWIVVGCRCVSRTEACLVRVHVVQPEARSLGFRSAMIAGRASTRRGSDTRGGISAVPGQLADFLDVNDVARTISDVRGRPPRTGRSSEPLVWRDSSPFHSGRALGRTCVPVPWLYWSGSSGLSDEGS